MAEDRTYFFCLGATKAGTTWLHDQLSRHEDCHLRTIKEFHYFNRSKPADFDAAMAANLREIDRLTAACARRDEDKNGWARANMADLADYNAVLAARQSDAPGFARMLAAGAGRGQLVADMTPAYALLPAEKLQALAGFAPDTRALYLMRDPVARLWSHIRMVAGRLAPKRMVEMSAQLLNQILSGDLSGEGRGIVDRGDYAAIVPKLRAAFDPKRLLVMFYEDLMTLPGFSRLCAFLGIADHAPDFGRRVHASAALDLRAEEAARAYAYLRPQYEFAAHSFPALPAAWRPAMNEA